MLSELTDAHRGAWSLARHIDLLSLPERDSAGLFWHAGSASGQGLDLASIGEDSPKSGPSVDVTFRCVEATKIAPVLGQAGVVA